MIPATTLLSLACAIANQTPIATAISNVSLSPAEAAQVEEYFSDGSCLPENLESVLLETRSKVNAGELKVNGANFRESPTEMCTK